MALYDLTSGPVSTTSTNQWQAVYAETLGAGSVNADNAFRLVADVQAASSATVAKVRLSLRGVVFWTLEAVPPQARIVAEIQRVGSTGGRWLVTLEYDTGTTQGRGQWRGDIATGLNWSQGQELRLEGYGNVSGAVVMRGAGVEK